MDESGPSPQLSNESLKRSLLNLSTPFQDKSAGLVNSNKRLRLEGPSPMTAAAALAEARQRSKSPLTISGDTKTSPNPATEALSALMGVSQNAVSQAYTPTTMSSPRNMTSTPSSVPTRVVENGQSQTTGTTMNVANLHLQTSPTTTSSFEGQDSITAPSGIGATVTSPKPMDLTSQQPGAIGGVDSTTSDEGVPSTAYATPLLTPHIDGRRGMSLPHSATRRDTRSPSSKKHQCPFCKTEFTRHHNLKSHLLTHSQEKPYVCSTCQSRFRRLHDLKRHTKLHTGERPHVCPKCNRKFARGDALARHNKGPGGCAGRRASLGSFGGDDDMDGNDDTMDGVMYNEPESMEDMDDGTARATPTIRRQAPSGDDAMEDSESYSRIPSTYPPIQGRPSGGIASGAFPPRPSYGPAPPVTPALNMQNNAPPLFPSSGSGPTLRPSDPNSVFAHNPLTESPKPISPSQSHRGSDTAETRMQSPNMPHFQPPSTFNRSHSQSGSNHASQPAGPQLPPPHSLNPLDNRFTLASQGAPTHPPTQPSGPPTHMSGSGPLSSHSNSLSSHGASGPGSGETGLMFKPEDRIWAYVKNLESRIETMQGELNTLKSQLAAAAAATHQLRT